MINWTTSRVNKFLFACWTYAFIVLMSVILVAIVATCAIPHDFGMHNNLKTICHVFEGPDGYRRQATVHINSSKNTHESHPWDYGGRCEE